MRHLALDTDHPSLVVPLEHLPEEQALLHDQPGQPAVTGAYRVPSYLQAGASTRATEMAFLNDDVIVSTPGSPWCQAKSTRLRPALRWRREVVTLQASGPSRR